MRELAQKYTIVIVTHNMQQAARASDWTGFFGWAAWWSSTKPTHCSARPGKS